MSEHAFIRPSPLSNSDALLIAIFIAAIFHTLIILGVNFSTPKTDQNRKSIEITLVTQKAVKAPKKSEFLAQNNQIGTGQKQTKPTPAANKAISFGSKIAKPPGLKASQAKSRVQKQVLTQKKAVEKIQQQATNQSTDTPKPKISMAALRQQLSDLGKKIRYKKPSTNNKRIKFAHSVNAHKYLAAQYITDWQRKIENMGNLNYPVIAKRPGFTSSLIMDVGIKPDGTIYSIRISKSSGYPALDQAAKRIVSISAPFPPLPKALLQEVDVLVITRVWKFSDESGLHTR